MGCLSTGCLIIISSLESRLRGSDRLEAILDGGGIGTVYGNCFLCHYVQCTGTVDSVVSPILFMFKGGIRNLIITLLLRRDIASGHWLLWPDSPGCVRSACGVAWASFSRIRLLISAGFFFCFLLGCSSEKCRLYLEHIVFEPHCS
jgi:hypothetical protein